MMRNFRSTPSDRRPPVVLPLALLLVLLALPTMPWAEQPQRVAPAAFGEVFPVAKLANLNAEAGGPTIDLAAYVGKRPVVFCYWIAGHKGSEDMLQRLQALVEEYGSDKLALLGVVTERPGREAPQIIERIKELDLRVPVLNDEGFRIGQQLVVSSVPGISLLDADGQLRLTNGVSFKQTIEYNLDLEGVIRRAAKTGAIGTHGQLPRYYPVNELVGSKCPDFQAPDLQTGVVRRWHSMLDPEQVNVLVFWSVDCPHCKKTMPQINDWLKQNPGGINLVSAAKVTSDVMKTRTKEFCSVFEFDFPTLADDGRAVAEKFQVTATPTILVIRPDGVIDSVLIHGSFSDLFEAKKKELL